MDISNEGDWILFGVVGDFLSKSVEFLCRVLEFLKVVGFFGCDLGCRFAILVSFRNKNPWYAV